MGLDNDRYYIRGFGSIRETLQNKETHGKAKRDIGKDYKILLLCK